MKLWGKVVSAFLLAMAAMFAGVAVVVPDQREVSASTAVLLATGGLFGVPTLVRLFMSFTGDEDVLRNGVSATATILSLAPTGWRYNRYYPIVRFKLSVEHGGMIYTVEIKQAIEPELFEQLAPGVVMGVRVDQSDRKKVVIDTRQPIRAAVMGSTIKQ